MNSAILTALLITGVGGFLYWAYLPDYKRNPTEFIRTLIGMPLGMFLGLLGHYSLNEKLKKWAIQEKKERKTK